MVANNDMFDLQHLNGKLRDRQAVQIGVNDQVGDVVTCRQTDFAGYVNGIATKAIADSEAYRWMTVRSDVFQSHQFPRCPAI